MPTIKRWFHANQDLNRDPEFRELAKKFGLGGVRFWLEALAILDRTDNFWDLHRGFDLGLLAASCETKRNIIQRSYEHLVNINWLRVGVDQDMIMFIYAPNWAKYNKKREDKGSVADTLRGDEKLHPIPSPIPSPIPKENIFPNRGKGTKTPWPDTFILTDELEEYARKNGVSNPAEEFENFRLKSLAHNYRYADWGKAWMAWCRSPLQKTPSLNGNGKLSKPTGCVMRIQLEEFRFGNCGNPPAGEIRGKILCAEHLAEVKAGA